MNIEVLVGKQLVKGSYSNKYFKLYATDYGISKETTVVKSNALVGNRFGGGNSFVGGINIQGDIPFHCTAQSLLFLLSGAGFDITSVGDNHTLVSGEDLNTYYTVILNNKTKKYHEIHRDCKINSIQLNVETQSYVNSVVNFIGMHTDRIDGLYTDKPVEYFDDELLKNLNSITKKNDIDNSCKLKAFNFTINNNLEQKKCLNSVFTTKLQLGTGNIDGQVEYNRLYKTEHIGGWQDIISAISNKISLDLIDSGGGNVNFTFHNGNPKTNDDGDYTGVGSLTQEYNFDVDLNLDTPLTMQFDDVIKKISDIYINLSQTYYDDPIIENLTYDNEQIEAIPYDLDAPIQLYK